MLIDLHTHTSRYSKCGRMTPEEMATQALAVGLDGVVITEHHVKWNEEELNELRAQFPTLALFSGFEVTTAERHDVLIYGVPFENGFYPRMSAAEAVAKAHELGGVAILAHPLRYHLSVAPAVMAIPFDACETRSFNTDPDLRQATSDLAERLHLPAVYNSDAHETYTLGGYANEFTVPVKTERDLVEALRARAFIPREQPQWLEPAMAKRVEAWETRVRRFYNERGVQDPLDIWTRVGGSLDRIQRVIAAIQAQPAKEGSGSAIA